MASRRAGAALVLALALAGCGDSSGGNGQGERSTRIVSLSPSATETLFALGAGGQVVAVDAESDHPPRLRVPTSPPTSRTSKRSSTTAPTSS